MEHDEDCFFWLDMRIPEDVRHMSVMCLSCHEEHPELGWFWEGSIKGYGPYEYRCDTCGKVLHAGGKP
jgi:hypothetical protein